MLLNDVHVSRGAVGRVCAGGLETEGELANDNDDNDAAALPSGKGCTPCGRVAPTIRIITSEPKDTFSPRRLTEGGNASIFSSGNNSIVDVV
jgi:hypothetical protein